MAKDDVLEVDGIVTDTLPNATFKVKLDTGHEYGYRVDITLALYVFKTSTNPQLVFYRTYHFLRYYSPKGQYLPLLQSLTEPIAESFYINLVRDLDPLIEKWKRKFKHYEELGKDIPTKG
jgi:hypothetical protein